MNMKQVNLTEKVTGESYYWVSQYDINGYVGKLTDTVYTDGADTTDWCLFVGTEEECEDYIEAHS